MPFPFDCSDDFADLGLPNPEEHLIKAEFVHRIAAIIKTEGLKQAHAAGRLGIAKPDVSKMLNGHFRQFSVERLMRFLVALGHDAEIVVRAAESHKRQAQITVAQRAGHRPHSGSIRGA
jgi:predicted XRE-type DNA-binding protein